MVKYTPTLQGNVCIRLQISNEGYFINGSRPKLPAYVEIIEDKLVFGESLTSEEVGKLQSWGVVAPPTEEPEPEPTANDILTAMLRGE